MIVAYGEDPAQIIEVSPGRNGRQRPLVIIIHGGFWRPDIDRVHARPMAEAIAKTRSGEIQDAKTMIGLQWLELSGIYAKK